MTSSDSEESWVLLKLTSPTAAALYRAGLSIDDLILSLSDDDVFFGAQKVMIDSNIKYFKFYFIGAEVSGMKKAKVRIPKFMISCPRK